MGLKRDDEKKEYIESNCLNQTYNGIEKRILTEIEESEKSLNQTYNGIETQTGNEWAFKNFCLNQTYNGIETQVIMKLNLM